MEHQIADNLARRGRDAESMGRRGDNHIVARPVRDVDDRQIVGGLFHHSGPTSDYRNVRPPRKQVGEPAACSPRQGKRRRRTPAPVLPGSIGELNGVPNRFWSWERTLFPLTAIRYASPCQNNPPSSCPSPRTGPAPSPSQPTPTTSNTAPPAP